MPWSRSLIGCMSGSRTGATARSRGCGCPGGGRVRAGGGPGAEQRLDACRARRRGRARTGCSAVRDQLALVPQVLVLEMTGVASVDTVGVRALVYVVRL